MKIMTFNTQHCKNYLEQFIDIPLMAKVIRDSGADIVSLNEMYGQGSAPNYTDQTGTLAQMTGMHHYFARAIGYDGVKPYGNGLLSRLPIVEAQTIMIPDPPVKNGPKNYETRCVLKAKLEGGITVLVTHMGLNPNEEENAVQTVLENLETEKCILMGDFNVLPDDPVLLPIRQRMKDAADLIPGPVPLTWPSDAPEKKLDYIFVTPDVEILWAEVPRIIASDHFPHVAEVKL